MFLEKVAVYRYRIHEKRPFAIYKSIYIVRPPAACPPFGHKADLRGAVAVKVTQYLRLSPYAAFQNNVGYRRVGETNMANAAAFAVVSFVVGLRCHEFASLFLAVAVEIVWLALGETSQIGQRQTQQNKIIMHFHRIFNFQIQRIFGEKLLHILYITATFAVLLCFCRKKVVPPVGRSLGPLLLKIPNLPNHKSLINPTVRFFPILTTKNSFFEQFRTPSSALRIEIFRIFAE